MVWTKNLSYQKWCEHPQVSSYFDVSRIVPRLDPYQSHDPVVCPLSCIWLNLWSENGLKALILERPWALPWPVLSQDRRRNDTACWHQPSSQPFPAPRFPAEAPSRGAGRPDSCRFPTFKLPKPEGSAWQNHFIPISCPNGYGSKLATPLLRWLILIIYEKKLEVN